MTATLDNRPKMDLTTGKLFKKILILALPIMFSGVLQLLYSAADLIVCGLFGSEHAVGAISSTGSLVNLIIQLFMGISVGANVVMAMAIGEKDHQKAYRTVHTTMLFSFISGIVLGIFGALFSYYFLLWMNSPMDVINLSTQYLTIYFCGLPFLMIYNFGSAILRAVGDTKRPFYYLSFAGVLNVILNLIFVIVFKMDVAGVALATIISQAISAVLIIRCMIKEKGLAHLNLKELKIHKDVAKEILRVGLPAGLQGSVFSLSNVLIQSSVNSLGTIVMDGNGAAVSIENFVYVFMSAIAQANVSFVSANYGAKKYDNIVKTIKSSLLMVTMFGLGLGIIVTTLAHPLVSIYVNHQDAIDAGCMKLTIMCLTYFTCGIMDTLAYSLRGLKHSVMPAIISLLGACGFRILWVYTIFQIPACHNMFWLTISYPISWIITSSVHLIFLIKVLRNVRLELSYNDQLKKLE